MSSWFVFALLLLLMAAVIIVPLAIRAGRRTAASAGPPGEDARAGGRVVGAAIVVGWIAVVWVSGFTILQAVAIGTGDWPVPVLTEPYWPQVPPDHFISVGDGEYGPGDTIIAGGGFTEASAIVPDLPLAARIADIVAVAIQGAALVLTALVVIRLCRNLRTGRGLAGAGRMFGALSILALLGGFGWQLAQQLGGTLAAHQVDLGGFGHIGDEQFSWPIAAGSINIDFWPILPFLALGALAAAFRYAERLQHDTEGLV